MELWNQQELLFIKCITNINKTINRLSHIENMCTNCQDSLHFPNTGLFFLLHKNSFYDT